MTLFCEFCDIRCKSYQGLVRHTRQKHNLRTRNQSFRSQETNAPKAPPRQIKNTVQPVFEPNESDDDDDDDEDEISTTPRMKRKDQWHGDIPEGIAAPKRVKVLQMSEVQPESLAMNVAERMSSFQKPKKKKTSTLPIGDLCKKYRLSDELWKSCMKMLHKHLFTKNLFPNCNGDDSDIVINILRELDIETKDIAGELYDTIHHQITVARSHIREVFEKKFDHIFEDIQYPMGMASADFLRNRQNAVQPLRINNKFIYLRDDTGKFVKPFTSLYIQRSLHFLLFRKKPRFPMVFTKGEHINFHTIAVVCTFLEYVTWPEAIPRTFNEKDHKKMYLKWIGMVEKVRKHIDLVDIEKRSIKIRIAGLPQADDEELEDDMQIPDVPLELELEEEEVEHVYLDVQE